MNRGGLFGRALLLSLLLMTGCLNPEWITIMPTSTPHPSKDEPKTRPAYSAGAYYYPWHHDDFHGRKYLREQLVPAQEPLLGEYNDRDADVIRRHLEWSRYAGIQFWAASWWGPGSREDVTIREHILPHDDLGDFQIALLYETNGRTKDFADFANVRRDIRYMARNYFEHPNYLRVDDKPVLFVYLTRVLSQKGSLKKTMTRMRRAAADEGFELFIVGDHVFGSPPASAGDIALLDAVTNYDVYGSMAVNGYATQAAVDSYYRAQAGWKALAQQAGVAFIPAVTPGFNDRGVRDGHQPLSRRLDRNAEFGSLLRAMLRGALPLTDAAVGHMLMVTTWNEWHEDTQIEPVRLVAATARDRSRNRAGYTAGLAYEGYGDRYLQILHDELRVAD